MMRIKVIQKKMKILMKKLIIKIYNINDIN